MLRFIPLARRLLGRDFQLDVLEPDFRRPARVELEGEDAAAGAGGVVEIDARLAVDQVRIFEPTATIS